jgi:hypothetical protein
MKLVTSSKYNGVVQFNDFNILIIIISLSFSFNSHLNCHPFCLEADYTGNKKRFMKFSLLSGLSMSLFFLSTRQSCGLSFVLFYISAFWEVSFFIILIYRKLLFLNSKIASAKGFMFTSWLLIIRFNLTMVMMPEWQWNIRWFLPACISFYRLASGLLYKLLLPSQ